jgi:hypothetical protein
LQVPIHEIKKKGEIGDTPDREKGVHPWRMYQELRRRASGKKVGIPFPIQSLRAPARYVAISLKKTRLLQYPRNDNF